MPSSYRPLHVRASSAVFDLLKCVISDLTELLFPEPKLCSICQKPLPPPILPIPSTISCLQSVLCSGCMSRLAWVQPPFCVRCGRPWRHGRLCQMCASGVCQLQGVSPLVFTGSVRELVHDLKFRSRWELGQPLGIIAGSAALGFPDRWQPDAVVPIPLHRDRLEQRGYNQAELLAAGVSQALRSPVWADVLDRIKPTVPQSSLSLTDRLRNVQSAFTVPLPAKIAHRHILLVDDVHTTGATLHAAGMVLLRAGAASVRFTTLAVAVGDTDLAGLSERSARVDSE